MVINEPQANPEPFLAQSAQRALHLLAREHQRQGHVAADDQFGKDLPVPVAQVFAEEKLQGRLADGQGRAGELLLLAQEQEISPHLILGERGRVALEMIGQAPDATDVFLFGGRFVVFELDELLEFCDGWVMSIHRRPSMPPCAR